MKETIERAMRAEETEKEGSEGRMQEGTEEMGRKGRSAGAMRWCRDGGMTERG